MGSSDVLTVRYIMIDQGLVFTLAVHKGDLAGRCLTKEAGQGIGTGLTAGLLAVVLCAGSLCMSSPALATGEWTRLPLERIYWRAKRTRGMH